MRCNFRFIQADLTPFVEEPPVSVVFPVSSIVEVQELTPSQDAEALARNYRTKVSREGYPRQFYSDRPLSWWMEQLNPSSPPPPPSAWKALQGETQAQAAATTAGPKKREVK